MSSSAASVISATTHRSAVRWGPVPALARLLGATLGAAAAGGALVVAAADVAIEPFGFLRFGLLASAMLALAAWCRWRYPDPRLAHAAALVGVGTISLLICGIVSNLGLRLGAPLIDSALAAADAALGFDVDRSVRAMAQWPPLIDLLAAVYQASGAGVVVLIALALARQRAGRAWELAATCVISMQLVAFVSIACPAIGAGVYLRMGDLQGAGLPIGAGVYHLSAFDHFRSVGELTVRIADLGGLVTFPSFHTVLALLATQALWDTRLRWIGVAWSVLVIVSTVPIGGHYVADLAAGLLIWMATAALARRAVLNIPSA